MDAWRELCERLVATGKLLGTGAFPQDDRGRAEAFRHLARQLTIALEGELAHGDPRHPSFHRYEEPWSQWGGPNPDNVYLRCAIDPAATYRVSADVTGLRSAIFSLAEGDMHLGKYGVYNERTLDTLEIASGGRLDITISPAEQPGNWMPSHPDARLFMIRQYQCDWERDRVATFRIECTDVSGPPPPPNAADVAGALRRASAWVEASIEYWCAYVERARGAMTPNAFGPAGTPKGGAPNIAYGSGWWRLDEGEALLIESEVPDADYWTWTIHNRYWLDSGDFANRQTSLNMIQTHADPDGRVRFVVAHADPGVPNWIDTEGRPEGMLVFRYIGARTKPVPNGIVTSLDRVAEMMPGDHPTVSTEQRHAQLTARRHAVLARYV